MPGYSGRSGFIAPQTYNFDATNTGSEFQCPGANKINIDVAGAAVFVQFSFPTGPTASGDPYLPTEFPLRAGFYSFNRRTNKIRFRSTGISTVSVDAS